MRTRRPTLLVIEDALDQALLVSVTARRAHPGLEVRIANDGREGIDYLEGAFQDESSPIPDLIILDLIMPEVDGFDVLEWIYERPNSPKAPVVVLTTSMNPHDARRALELGAEAVFTKPTDLDALAKVVREIVDRWIGVGTIIGVHMSELG